LARNWNGGIAIVTAVAFAGCGTTATIHRQNGPAYEAEILSSDARSLHIRGDDNRTYAVPGAEISDVDHPGNPLIVAGGVLAGIAGLAMLGINGDQNSTPQERRDGMLVIGLIYGVPGLLMMLAGSVPYYRSKRGASEFENAATSSFALPPPSGYQQAYPPVSECPPCVPRRAPPAPPKPDEPHVTVPPAGEAPAPAAGP
jgi:hypothetical protein